MKFKNFLQKVKSAFKSLGLKIVSAIKAIGPKSKSAAKKLWKKIRNASIKTLITYIFIPILLFALCLILALCTNENAVSDDTNTNQGGSGDVEEEVIHYGPKYELLADGTYQIYDYVYMEGETEVVIEAVYEKCNVTRIDAHAFENDDLVSITLPDTITSIGDYAFAGCSSLKSLIIPKNVSNIGTHAFANCGGLSSVEFKCASSATTRLSIGERAFTGCFVLADAGATATYYDIVLPENVVAVGEGAFEGCTAIKSVSLPKTLEDLSVAAFYGCISLESVTFAEGCKLELIAPKAFMNCSALASVNIPGNVAMIGYDAFNGCSALASVTLPASLKSIGSHAFYGCGILTEVKLPTPDFISTLELVNKYSDPTAFAKEQ